MADDDWPFLFSDVSRHGQRRWFVRLPKRKKPDGRWWRPKIRIHAKRGTEEFATQYWAARNSEPAAPVQRPGPARRGTFRFIAEHYLNDSESPFQQLELITQQARRRILLKLIDKVGERQAVLSAEKIRAGVVSRGHGAAKDFRTALRKVYEYALSKHWVDQDPTAGIKVRKKKTAGFKTWDLAACLKYEAHWPIGTKQRTAYAIGLYLATRRSDAVQLGRQHERNDGKEVAYTQWKNRNRDPVHMIQPIVPPLREALNGWQGKGLSWLETDYGYAFTIQGFGERFSDWCVTAGLPGYTFHGLRKATSVRLAEMKMSTKEIQAVLGDRTLQQAEVYTRDADRARLARGALQGLYGEQMDPLPPQVGPVAAKKV